MKGRNRWPRGRRASGKHGWHHQRAGDFVARTIRHQVSMLRSFMVMFSRPEHDWQMQHAAGMADHAEVQKAQALHGKGSGAQMQVLLAIQLSMEYITALLAPVVPPVKRMVTQSLRSSFSTSGFSSLTPSSRVQKCSTSGKSADGASMVTRVRALLQQRVVRGQQFGLEAPPWA